MFVTIANIAYGNSFIPHTPFQRSLQIAFDSSILLLYMLQHVL
jgi:hypothetical protein